MHSYLILLADEIDSFICLIIYLLSQYLRSICYVPGTMLGTGDTEMKKQTTTLCSQGLHQGRYTIKNKKMSDHKCYEEKLNNIGIRTEVVVKVTLYYREVLSGDVI